MHEIFARLEEKRKLLGNSEKNLKMFDENSIEKLNFHFIFILENLLQKIEPSEMTPFFYNNFFGFGEIFPFPHGYALWFRLKLIASRASAPYNRTLLNFSIFLAQFL